MRKKVYSNKWIPRFDYEEVVQSKKYLLPYILPYKECRKEEDKKRLRICVSIHIY